jgi:hypothetical protein
MTGERFSKLRFGELGKVAAAAAVGGALALQPAPAGATPVNVGSGTGIVTITAGNATWFVNNDITFSTTSSAWGFSEASLHTNSGTRHDAFDGAISWHVNATPGQGSANAYVSPSGTIDISPNFPTNPNVATTLTGAPQTLQGLTVTGEMFFSTTKAVARSTLILQNPSGAPITVTVLNASNFGSDQNTVLQATSSGDNVFDPTDNWFVSSETANPTPANDPVLTVAFSGAAGAVRGSNVNAPGSGQKDLFYENYTLTVPAGQTRRLMMFVQMSDTVAHAEADALTFNTTGSLQAAGLLNGLTPPQLAEVVNWNFSLAPVPTLGDWALRGMVGLLALLGVFSLGAFRRRSRFSTGSS